jgi:hypothetical protein
MYHNPLNITHTYASPPYFYPRRRLAFYFSDILFILHIFGRLTECSREVVCCCGSGFVSILAMLRVLGGPLDEMLELSLTRLVCGYANACLQKRAAHRIQVVR